MSLCLHGPPVLCCGCVRHTISRHFALLMSYNRASLKADEEICRSSLARTRMEMVPLTRQMTSSLWWWMAHGPWDWRLPSCMLGRSHTLCQLRRVGLLSSHLAKCVQSVLVSACAGLPHIHVCTASLCTSIACPGHSLCFAKGSPRFESPMSAGSTTGCCARASALVPC